MDKEKLAANLREFVADWRKIAETEGKESLLEIDVSLVHVLYDFCKMAEIGIEEIGLAEGSRL